MSEMNDKRLLGTAFPGDTGETSPEVAAVLQSYAAGESTHGDVLSALAAARVLVPVVAVLGEVEVDEAGLAHDKTSDMATVLLTGADGRQALLGFTGTAALRAWQADARPVPVSLLDAAQAAVHDGADALVLDLAGPVPFAIEGDDLRKVAEGWQLATVGQRTAWVRP
ncbi:type III secretion system (T3SS) SseB-like protein [Nocardioides albertanoniae]|uniref:Type III secretion system (T3SS) SseB-like protein n=2 Tax=Nocardioides albertanoniae TaxID=1175486 RepID=A0A543A8B0_9ACTN|nr:type III secretion system (T3SS) SseB-like protein [Nocardioides albertanoniae]